MNTLSLKTAVNSVKHWYIPLVVGILLILVGIYVFTTPTASYLALSVVFSLSFLVSGILQVIFSVANRQEIDSWGWYLAGGVLYTLVGILLLARPEISLATLPFVVGFFVLFHSVNALGWAYDLKNMGIINWGNIATVSVLGIIFSFILLWNPLFAGLSLVFWTGIAFVFAGSGAIMVSLKLKKIKDLPNKLSDELKSRIKSVTREYQEMMSQTTAKQPH
ncbi:HdeD family acid-resistance protein [Catalinimonas sp. 4WD22]|uniref:HdeD family acid-resistance protein n=1 Tax=Catalinimonas locisalis TaxID=3133978 RepID=UPI0031015571